MYKDIIFSPFLRLAFSQGLLLWESFSEAFNKNIIVSMHGRLIDLPNVRM